MSGGSREHNLIVTNIVGELRSQLKGRPCEVFANDMRVKVSTTGLYTYPDVVVVCGEPQFEDANVDTLMNPTVVMEVLSDSTESYDRGGKFGCVAATSSSCKANTCQMTVDCCALTDALGNWPIDQPVI